LAQPPVAGRPLAPELCDGLKRPAGFDIIFRALSPALVETILAG
jgi:hypothetical protein